MIGFIMYLVYCGLFVLVICVVIGLTDCIYIAMIAFREDVERKIRVFESGFIYVLY